MPARNKIYYADTCRGATLIEAATDREARSTVQREVGTQGEVKSVRLCTVDDFNWVDAMGGWTPKYYDWDERGFFIASRDTLVHDSDEVAGETFIEDTPQPAPEPEDTFTELGGAQENYLESPEEEGGPLGGYLQTALYKNGDMGTIKYVRIEGEAISAAPKGTTIMALLIEKYNAQTGPFPS